MLYKEHGIPTDGPNKTDVLLREQMNETYVDNNTRLIGFSVFVFTVALALVNTASFISFVHLVPLHNVVNVSLEFVGILLMASLSPVLIMKSFDNRHVFGLSLIFLTEVLMLFMGLLFLQFQAMSIDSEMVLSFIFALQISVLYSYVGYVIGSFCDDRNEVSDSLFKLVGMWGISVTVCFLLQGDISVSLNEIMSGPYTWPSLIVLILLLVPLIYSLNLLKKYDIVSTQRKILWSFPVAVTIGIVLQTVTGDVVYGILMLSYGFIFIYATEYVGNEARLSYVNKSISVNKMQSLSHQLTPHFMFNSLTAIMNMPSNNDDSREVIECFSVYLRNSLDSMSRLKPIPFEIELKQTESYVLLASKVYGNKLVFGFSVEDKDFSISSLVIRYIISRIVYSNPVSDLSKLEIQLTTKTIGESHRVIITSRAKPLQKNVIYTVSENLDVNVISYTLAHACKGRVRYVYDEDNKFMIILDIYGDSR